MSFQENPEVCVVVIPTYNERENIADLIEGLMLDPRIQLLFVDDGSPDGTQEQILSFNWIYPNRIELISRETKRGLASAYSRGFAQALTSNSRFIAQMDADGSHRNVDLFRMLDSITSDRSLDIVVGSRWINGGSVENWPKKRIFLSRSASLIVSRLLNLSTKDVTSGFKIFRHEALGKILNEKIQTSGYCFQIEVARISRTLKLNSAEIPIKFPNRVHGSSKISFTIILEAGFQVIKWMVSSK